MRHNETILNTAAGVVGVSLIALLGFSLWSLFHLDVPIANKDVLLIVIGALTTKVGTIVDFFFGGSQDTRTKPSLPPADVRVANMQPGDEVKVTAAAQPGDPPP